MNANESLTKETLMELIDEVLEEEDLEEKKKNGKKKRDYSKEPKTAGNKENIKRKQNKRDYEKKYGKCPPGQELHHVNGISSDEVRCEPIGKNRGRKGEGNRKTGPRK